jgi:DNA repair protein RadC
MRDTPESERPRERLMQVGAENLSHAELIAILLRTGTKGRSVMEVAKELIAMFNGSLQGMANARVSELSKIKGIGRDKAIALKSAFTLAQRMAREIRGEAPLLSTPESVADLLRDEFRNSETEEFVVVLLNVRQRLIRTEKVSTGILDSILVHPREVFKHAVAGNASSVVLAHNHPSGDPSPSEADIRVTRDLIRAGQVLKIPVFDHVIMGKRTAERLKDYVSLRELGHFYT